MRNAFTDELTKLGDDDDRVVMLSGDIGNRLFDKFKGKHPLRFFNCGVAEANMTGLAAGLGHERPAPGHLHDHAFRHDALPRADPHRRLLPRAAGHHRRRRRWPGLCRPRPDAPCLRGHRLPARAAQHGGDCARRRLGSARGAARRHEAGQAGLHPHGQEGRARRSPGPDRRLRDRQGDHHRQGRRGLPAVDRQHAAGSHRGRQDPRRAWPLHRGRLLPYRQAARRGLPHGRAWRSSRSSSPSRNTR